ncbi:hypothetical protein LCGC14_2407180, partial [marine sediment metagenome]
MPQYLWSEKGRSKRDLLTTMPEEERRRRFTKTIRSPYWSAAARQYNVGAARAGVGAESFRSPAQMAGQAWGIEPFQTPLQRETTKSDIFAQRRRPTEESAMAAAKLRGTTSPLDIAEKQSASQIATEALARTGTEQTQRFAAETQPTTLAKGRVDLLSSSLEESIAGLDAHIANLQAGFATAQTGGATPEDLQNYTQQIAAAQTERQRLSQQIAGAGQLGQMPEQPLPQGQPQGFQFEAQPQQAGSRLNFLAGQADRAGQEADIIMANTGLSNMTEMLAGLEGLKPWDEGAIFTMQE